MQFWDHLRVVSFNDIYHVQDPLRKPGNFHYTQIRTLKSVVTQKHVPRAPSKPKNNQDLARLCGSSAATNCPCEKDGVGLRTGCDLILAIQASESLRLRHAEVSRTTTAGQAAIQISVDWPGLLLSDICRSYSLQVSMVNH